MRINYISLADNTGYAIAGRRYIEILRNCGVDVRWLPMLPGPGLGMGYQFGDGRLDPDAPTILHTVPEYYPLLNRRLLHQGNTAPRIGMTVWETTRLPRHWAPLLNDLQAVIVPTEWNAQVFAESGVRVRIHVLPHASEFEGRPASDSAIEALLDRLPPLGGRFVFYSISTWMKRKGTDRLIEAFLHAFAGRNDVVLLLKTSEFDEDRAASRWSRWMARFTSHENWRKTAQTSRSPAVIILTETLTTEDIRALHSIGDCFVSLARGDGWGLGSYEAAFFGKPLIVNGFGGHLAFAPAHLSTHVRYRLIPVSLPGNSSYTPDQTWAEPDLQHAVDSLQAMLREKHAMKARAVQLRQFVRLNFSSPTIGDTLLRILHQFV